MTPPARRGASLPVTRAKRAALAEEQRTIDRIHERVEELRRRAERRVQQASADRSGPTFQARYERDVRAHHHATRAARYTFGDLEALTFGRLDLADAERFHIGRVSVVDEDGDVLLVDWRAPAAAPFYQATGGRPQGVARRRTLVTRGRELLDLDDEIVDQAAADRLGLEAVTGQGALLAALSRSRAPRMRDIVATIQAEQDRIIRSPASGTLVVTGGPGTGKTVVALHRVASLLYRDRARFEGRGVLVVGPSRAFTEYTSRVLPALGEDSAVQRPIAGLAPRGTRVEGWDPARLAGIKGDLAVVELARQVLAAVLPPIPPLTRFSFDGTTAQLTAEAVHRLRERHLARVHADGASSSYHVRRPPAEQALTDLLWRTWQRARTAAGGPRPDDEERAEFLDAAESFPQVRMLRRCFWPALDPVAVAGSVRDGRVDVRDTARGTLPDEDLAALAEQWSDAHTWSIDDVGFLDEIAALVGVAPSGARHVADDAEDEGLTLDSEQLHTEIVRVDVEDPAYRDFAHVVVDEAQDLSPLLWRCVARRAPYASWTVVGDLAQRSRPGEPDSWERIAELIGRRRVEIVRLDVNYRTPAEIAELAADVLEAAGGSTDDAPQAVRTTGRHPVHVVAEDLDGAVATRLTELIGEADGTVAVLGRADDVVGLAALADTLGADAERVRVLEVRAAKGLEFDDVVVVAPERVLAAELGAQQLYVAVTRATRSLTLVTRGEVEVPGLARCQKRYDPPR